jgi:hypothetical protein
MPVPAAGGIIYASHMIRAQPTPLWDAATSPLLASQSAQPIPGISIGFTTETAGANVDLVWTIQAAVIGTGSTAQMSARPLITGPSSFSATPSVFATYQSSVAASGNGGTDTNTCVITLGNAGSYTVTLLGTTGTNQNLNVYSSLKVIVFEQFA